MKKCPFCAEEIQDDAIKCRYCGEWLNTKPTVSVSYEQIKSQEKLHEQNDSLNEASKGEPPQEPPSTSLPQQSIDPSAPIEKNKQLPEEHKDRLITLPNEPYSINQIQKIILIAVIVVLVAMIAYPPFHFVGENGVVHNKGYGWIFNPPIKRATVNVAMLLIQWIGVIVVGGIAFFLKKGASSTQVTSSKQGTAVIPPMEKKNEEPFKSFSWRSLILAFAIAFVINIFASIAAGTKPAKNFVWTVMWIYLTIEAWKYWKWKALLPYPIYLLVTAIAGLIMGSVGADYRGMTHLIVVIALNIGGLIIFYALFRNSQKAHATNYTAANPWKSLKSDNKELLKGLAVIVCIIVIIIIAKQKDNFIDVPTPTEPVATEKHELDTPAAVTADSDFAKKAMEAYKSTKPKQKDRKLINGAAVKNIAGNKSVSLTPAPAPEQTTVAISTPAVPVEETARDGHFIAYSNGTVLDTKTNLMWAAKDNGSFLNWANAKSYCENYRGGSYTDWRMPTHDELAGLYDAEKTYKNDIGNVHLTELIRLGGIWVWASETRHFYGVEVANLFNFKDDSRSVVSDDGRPFSSQSSVHGRALPVRSAK